jgi:hypothetical protein
MTVGDEKSIQIFSSKTWKEKGPLRRVKCKWEESVELGLKEVGCESEHWIELAYDRVQWLAIVNMLMNLRVPWKVGSFLTSWDQF